MKKKQKRFYSNDKRGQKWTEPEVGRPIDFADKYIEPRTQAGQAELDRERRKKGPAFQKATPGQVVRRVLLVLLGLVLHAPIAIFCFIMATESALKVPFGLHRIRGGKWIHDVTQDLNA